MPGRGRAELLEALVGVAEALVAGTRRCPGCGRAPCACQAALAAIAEVRRRASRRGLWLVEDGIIDEVAVERALAGDVSVRLTPSERRVAVARSAGRLTRQETMRRFGVSGSTSARVRNTQKNYPGATVGAARACPVSH